MEIAYGTMSPDEWLKESKTQLISSKLLREAGTRKLEEFRKIRCGDEPVTTGSRAKAYEYLSEKESAYKCSILLMGYAIELALKAGIVKLYKQIPIHLAESNLKKEYSHKLDLMVQDLGISLDKRENELIKLLIDFILEKARYPISAQNRDDHRNEWNINQRNLQSDDLYKGFLALHEKIIDFTKSADRTSKNPAASGTAKFGDDGYFTFRLGGNLPTRIVFKYSSTQVESSQNTLEDLREIISVNSNLHPYFHMLINNWSDIDFFEHTWRDKLVRRT
ncbi:hypothetical protein [Microbulbifer variabilis]|uniref:hypothetical protein n=1 Tax=Microbulbifer variabilis TaxID=266805 RepID=UPI00037CFA3F|nr:hypothetical protein [Microbulbifer variabilis]